MQFLNPLFLIGSLALIGPILIHLFRKETSRTYRFSSLMFIKRMPRASIRRQRLRNPLLLALRLAALLLLVLAFARPLLTGPSLIDLPRSSTRSLVILLDDSFSMRFGSRFERAQSQARSILEGMTSADTVQTVVFSDSTRLLNQREAGPREVQQLINTVEPGFGGTDYRPALSLANRLLAGAPQGRHEIHWISDFQASGWKSGSDSISIDESVDLKTYPVARESGANVSIQQVTIRPQDPKSSRVTIAAKIRSQQLGQSRTIKLALKINDRISQSRSVHLEADDSKLIEFESVAVPPRGSTAKLRLLLEDALPEDNLVYHWLSRPPRLQTLLLGQQIDHFYLSKALTASPDSPFELDMAEFQQVKPAKLASYAAVILNNPGNLSSLMASALIRFVKSGGGLLLILGPRSDSAGMAGLQEVLPGALLKRYRAAGGGEDQRISRLQRGHPVFRLFEEDHHSYLLTTRYRDYFRVRPVEGSQVLATLQDGSPLLLERSVGRGLVLLYTSSLNRDWNELPLESIFLPFCQEMIKYVSRFEAPPRPYTVGETVTLQSLNPYPQRSLAKPSSSGASYSHPWTVVSPSGQAIRLDHSAEPTRASLKLKEPGFYRSRTGDFERVLAVNLDSTESDLEIDDVEGLLSRVTQATRGRDAAPQEHSAAHNRQALEDSQQLWWYLVLTALLGLLVESLLANRYYSSMED